MLSPLGVKAVGTSTTNLSALQLSGLVAGSVNTACPVAWHPLASVTVTAYDPGGSFSIYERLPPPALLHAYVYGPFPPAVLAATAPVESPIQFGLMPTAVTVKALGAFTAVPSVAVQLLASVTVTLYEPEPTCGFCWVDVKPPVPVQL